MKKSYNHIYIFIGILVIFSSSIISCSSSLQNKSITQKTDPKKAEAIKEITELYKNSAYNKGAIQSILSIAEKDTMNFDSYVEIAKLTSEFCYNTASLTGIAKSIYHAKTKSEYFKTLGDLAVMKLDGSDEISKLAYAISNLNTNRNTTVEKEIQALQKTADFKTIDEAKAYNKSILYKLSKTLPKQQTTTL